MRLEPFASRSSHESYHYSLYWQLWNIWSKVASRAIFVFVMRAIADISASHVQEISCLPK